MLNENIIKLTIQHNIYKATLCVIKKTLFIPFLSLIAVFLANKSHMKCTAGGACVCAFHGGFIQRGGALKISKNIF